MVGYWHGRNFMTLFFQLTVVSNHYIEYCPPLLSIHQKGLLPSEWKQTNTFPLCCMEMLWVCASQFWRWMSLWNAVTYFSPVLLQVLKTHKVCCDMLLNLSICKSEAGTPAQDCALRYPGGSHADDNACWCVSKMGAVSPCHTAHLNAGHPWTVLTAANEDVIRAVVKWEPGRYRTIIGTVPTGGRVLHDDELQLYHYLQRSCFQTDSDPLWTQFWEWLRHLRHCRLAYFT
jgi:hypothetical protein